MEKLDDYDDDNDVELGFDLPSSRREIMLSMFMMSDMFCLGCCCSWLTSNLH